MNKIFLALSLICSSSCLAQRASIDNDTASYNGKRYIVGDTINLAYGSDQGKKFAFVQMGGALLGLKRFQSTYSKGQVKVDKVYKQLGKCYLRGKMIDQPMPPGYKIFIDLEGAVDNKEMKENPTFR